MMAKCGKEVAVLAWWSVVSYVSTQKGYKDDESGTLRYELRWEMDGTRYTGVFSCVSKIVCLAALSLPNLLPEDFYPLKRTQFLLNSSMFS